MIDSLISVVIQNGYGARGMFYQKSGMAGIGTFDQGLSEDDVERIVQILNQLPTAERSSCAMKIASKLLEYAAYELAGRESATFVAELVDASAKFESASCELSLEPRLPTAPRLQ